VLLRSTYITILLIPVIHIYFFLDLRCVATTLALITHNSNYNDRDIRLTLVASTFVIRILPIHPSTLIMSSDPRHTSVSLRLSLADNPRTQIHDWFEDLSAKACGLCSQWDSTGAITIIATDEVWRAIPGHTTGAASHLVYRARPDFDPPAALDPAATAVDLANWRLEMQMHFAYTTAQATLANAILESVGLANQAALKVAHHSTPLHFLSRLLQALILQALIRKHATLTGPDLQKLRPPLLEPLLAIADIETHTTSFMLASMKLSTTGGHGEDPYRYFESFLATVQGFPLVVTAIAGYYNTHPLVVNQTIASLFAYDQHATRRRHILSNRPPAGGGDAHPVQHSHSTGHHYSGKRP
jgi:hypothetical protein